MPDSLKAPCGWPATLTHYKTCKHAGCKAKYVEFQRIKAETASAMKKFFQPKQEIAP